MADNVDIVLAKRPGAVGIVLGETFQPRTAPVPTAADLHEGQILVEVVYLSLDPVMRKWIQGEILPIAEGDIMRGPAALRVLASRAPGVNTGDFGTSFNTPWSSVFVLDVDAQGQSFHRVDVPAQTRPSDALGFLGLTGLTGYFGVTKLGRPVAGETFVVSTAAGATGSIAAQVAKLLGARVIGITGSESKCAWLRDELGLDVALNYKDPNFVRQFADAVGDGVDVYFDNVGGWMLELVLKHLKKYARIVLCGNISTYNDANAVGVRDLLPVAVAAATMYGLSIFEYADEYEAGRRELLHWFREGKLKRGETIIKGSLADAPRVLSDMYNGSNVGKLLVQVKDI